MSFKNALGKTVVEKGALHGHVGWASLGQYTRDV